MTADPVVQQLVAACLDEADRFTRDVFDRACETHPEDANAIAHRYQALRRSGLVGAGPIGGTGPDPWEAGAREALTDPDAARRFDAIGPYQPLRELGRGGQAVVYLAEDLRLHRPVALKILKGLGPLSETVMNRFRREAEVASKLDHPGICAVFDAGVRDGIPYIAMRFVPGETLGDHVEAAKKRPQGGDDASASISVGSRTKHEIHRLLEIVERAARALHAAHEAGIVHRDVKPGNIMVTPQGDPVLLDFGLAGDEDQELMTLTETGDILGTPAYMSPEQLMAKRIRVDRRTDIYSLGVTLFECLTLERPYRASTREAMYQAIQFKHPTDIRSLNAGLPADLKVIVETALEKDRDKRYRTAEDFADDLRRIREDEPIAARPVSALGRAWRWAKRRPMRAMLAAALIIGVPALTALLGHVIANRPAVLAAERQARLDEIEGHLEAGYAELAHGDPKKALKSFDAALAMDPSSGEAIGGKALALYRMHDYDACLSYLDDHGAIEGGAWAMHRVRIDALRKLGRDGAADDREERETAEPKTPLGFFLAGQQLMKGCVTHEKKDVFRRAHRYFRRAALTAPHARALHHLELAHAARHLGEEPEARQAAGALLTLWPDSARAAYESARALVPVDRTAAAAAIERAIELNPDYAPAHSMRAWFLHKEGRLDDAIAACRTAIELRPDRAQPHNLLGILLRDRRDLEGAIAAYRKSIELGPQYAVSYSNLGVALRNIGRPKEAVAPCRRAVELAPGRAMMHANLACALIGVSRYDEALEAVERALELDPNSGTAYHNRGEALGEKGRIEEAIAAYEKAIELEPDAAPAHYNNLGMLLQRQGRFEEAIAAYEKAVKRKPDEATYHFNLGVCLSRAGRHAPASAALARASELAPNDGFLHDSRGSALAAKGDFDAAIAAYERAIECAPENAGYRVNLGWAHLLKHDFEAALAACNEAIRLDPKNGAAHNNRASALKYLGRREEAIDAYRESIDLKPHLQNYHNLAAIYREAGQLEDEIATLKAAAAFSPSHAAYKNLAGALRDGGDLDGAIAAYEKSLRVKPECAGCLANLGNVYRRKGVFERAIRCYRKSLELSDLPLGRRKLAGTKKLLALEPKLDGIVAGETEPADTTEAVLFAQLAHCKRHFAAAARLWLEAFEREPAVAANLHAGHPLEAATAAAMASAGLGEDAAPLDENARRDLRRQALRWLDGQRAAFERGLAKAKLTKKAVHRRLRRWTWEPALAGIRDDAAVAKLRPDERAACEAFWAEVRALIERMKPTQPATK